LFLFFNFKFVVVCSCHISCLIPPCLMPCLVHHASCLMPHVSCNKMHNAT
jgi:hypothetical protein